MTRRLVISADDLGREPRTTEVVADLLADGAATATTLLAVSPHAAEAARTARELGIRPRVHLALTGDEGMPPWRALTDAPSLTGPDGALLTDPCEVGARGETEEVLAEIEAQRAWLESEGLSPTHADSHSGTLYGVHGRSWLAETLAWCGDHGLGFRLPRDVRRLLGSDLPAPLVALHADAVARADRFGVGLPARLVLNFRSAEDLGSYEALRDGYIGQLSGLPHGTSELILHPSTEDAAPGGAGVLRAWEARLLRDPAWTDALEREQLELVGGW